MSAVGAPIRKQITVRCDREHAFRVFTGKIHLWWPPSHAFFPGASMRMEPFVGGRFVAATDRDEQLLGEVLAWDPPERVRYSWNPGRGVGPTEVTVAFIQRGDETEVRVTHEEAQSQLGEAWSARARGFSAAWDAVLESLANHLLGGADPSP